jgi:hypothetical protein
MSDTPESLRHAYNMCSHDREELRAEVERLRALLKVLLDWPLTEEVRERVKQELGELR